MWSTFGLGTLSVDWDVIGREKMLLTLWISVRSTKLWQHWLTWQWVQQYIYHLWLCCRKSNKRQTIPFRAVTGSLWLTVHALEISAFKLHPRCWVGHWLKATSLLWSCSCYSFHYYPSMKYLNGYVSVNAFENWSRWVKYSSRIMISQKPLAPSALL